MQSITALRGPYLCPAQRQPSPVSFLSRTSTSIHTLSPGHVSGQPLVSTSCARPSPSIKQCAYAPDRGAPLEPHSIVQVGFKVHLLKVPTGHYGQVVCMHSDRQVVCATGGVKLACAVGPDTNGQQSPAGSSIMMTSFDPGCVMTPAPKPQQRRALPCPARGGPPVCMRQARLWFEPSRA